MTITPATRDLLRGLIRCAKGALTECEKWVEAQPSPLRNDGTLTWKTEPSTK